MTSSERLMYVQFTSCVYGEVTYVVFEKWYFLSVYLFYNFSSFQKIQQNFFVCFCVFSWHTINLSVPFPPLFQWYPSSLKDPFNDHDNVQCSKIRINSQSFWFPILASMTLKIACTMWSRTFCVVIFYLLCVCCINIF